jgi:capsular polysaccharide biosynthesis protein
MASTRTGFKSIQSGWRVLLVIILAFAAGALVWSLITTPMYRSQATFLVYPNANLTSSRDVVSSLDTLEGKTVSNTYADILDSQRVFQDTVDRLQLAEPALKNVRVSAEVQKDTNILVLVVEGPDPQLITLLANNIGQNGISFIKSIYQVFDISFLDLAREPAAPYHPQPGLYLLIAAGAGFIVGIIFLLIRESLRVPLEQLRERALVDKQSLAYNRKHFLRTLGQDLARKADEPLPYGLIRLQGLEDLVDGLPEGMTTRIMQDVVRRLHTMLRGNDMVARWEKLTFSVSLPSTPEAPAVKTFERLLQALEQPVRLDTGDEINLQPVAGVVIRRADDSLETMVLRGEETLNSALAGTRNLVVAK